jgi:hypothetical protein
MIANLQTAGKWLWLGHRLRSGVSLLLQTSFLSWVPLPSWDTAVTAPIPSANVRIEVAAKLRDLDRPRTA